MPPNALFLTGAPESGALIWDPTELLDTFSSPIARFTGLHFEVGNNSLPSLTPEAEAAWRSLNLSQQHLPTGFSQIYGYNSDATFFTPADLSFISNGDDPSGQLADSQISTTSASSAAEALSEFYNHSFAVHAAIPSSQLVPSSDQSNTQLQHLSQSHSRGASFVSNGTSFATATTTNSSASASQPLINSSAVTIPQGVHLIPLSAIPNAAHLSSIQPQTMTVNLVIGLISISPPRAIQTRRGANVEIVEMLVGDETKAGFGINYWLSEGSDLETRRTLEGLRPQDVVLLTNVALSSFRGKVYGQSLRKEMTKVHLLFRNRIDRSDIGGCYSAVDLAAGGKEGREGFDAGVNGALNMQKEKTKRVREWVMKFVGAGVVQRKVEGKSTRNGRVEMLEMLPPDTQ